MAKLKKKLSEVTYDFPYGESHNHTALTAEDITNLDDGKPGLYAWYLRVLPKEVGEDHLNCYGTIFGSKQYSIAMSAFLSEMYEGDLSLTPAFDAAKSANIALLSTVTTVFSPPIYVGIAKNTRERLMTHLRSLKKELLSAAPAALPPPPPPSPTAMGAAATTPSAPAMDTDEESGFFGGRIAYLLKSQGITDVRHLFVKVVFQDPDNGTERRAVEHFANRVFFPFCGRR